IETRKTDPERAARTVNKERREGARAPHSRPKQDVQGGAGRGDSRAGVTIGNLYGTVVTQDRRHELRRVRQQHTARAGTAAWRGSEGGGGRAGHAGVRSRSQHSGYD